MVIISKPLFDKLIRSDISCKTVFHKTTNSCFKSDVALSFRYFIPGIFWYYLPIYMIKLLIDYKKINKSYLKKILFSYLRSECYGLSYGFLILSYICFSNKLLGRLHYLNLTFLPGFISGLSLLCEDKPARILNTVLWASMVIEAIFNNAYYFEFVKYSPLRETILFMVISSVLMQLWFKRNKKKAPISIWFYFPSTNKDLYKTFNFKKNLSEFFKYFGLGFGLSSARSIFLGIANFYKKSFKSIFKKTHLKSGLVFGLYAFLFKTSLFLLETFNGNKEANVGIAGFIAGMSYYIRPTLNLLTLALVTAVQIFLSRFLVFQKSTKIPYALITYMLSNGILFQNRIANVDTCPKYYKHMLKSASNGLIETIYNNVLNEYIL